ncbi:Protein T20F5.6, partial [Aphelenchoides avenae]
MTTNENAVTLAKECPVCHDPFDGGATVPKVFVACGHSVCARCILRILRDGRATCPLCRQETSIPRNGLPTNYALI